MSAFVSGRRSLVAALLSALCTLLLVVPLHTHAQEQDGQGLRTELPPIDRGVLGEPQLIEADVGEATELVDIDLYYRFDGGAYVPIPMSPTTRPGVYAASVPTRDRQATRMEYYILATDTDGAQLLKGGESAPLVRELVTPAGSGEAAIAQAPVVDEAPPVEETPVSSNRSGVMKYVYIGLGVLAVGALAAAATDSGGGSSDESCGPEGCNLTVVVPPPIP